MLVTAEQELLALRQLQAAAPHAGTAAFSLSSLEAELLRYRGQLTEAAGRLQALRAELTAAGDLQLLVDVAQTLADVRFEMAEEREGEAAAHEAIRASQQFSGTSISPDSLLSAWYAGRGELEQARSLLSRARDQAGKGPLPVDSGFWLSRAEAHLAAAEGRWPAALAAFERLAGLCRRVGARWYEARIAREWAEALVARGEAGDRQQAFSLLGKAAAEFDAIGAPFYAEQAEQRIDELAQR
jgi:tetratricopeptide (TPR) repeat protein